MWPRLSCSPGGGLLPFVPSLSAGYLLTWCLPQARHNLCAGSRHAGLGRAGGRASRAPLVSRIRGVGGTSWLAGQAEVAPVWCPGPNCSSSNPVAFLLCLSVEGYLHSECVNGVGPPGACPQEVCEETGTVPRADAARDKHTAAPLLLDSILLPRGHGWVCGDADYPQHTASSGGPPAKGQSARSIHRAGEADASS